MYHVPLLGNKVHWTIQSLVVPNDRGNLANPFNLTPTQLNQRHLIHTSLTDDPSLLPSTHLHSPHPPPAAEDARLFCPAGGRGPLGVEYAAVCEAPFVCVYSLVDVRVGVWGVQGLAEEYIGRELTAVWCRLLRLVWCWQDDWRARSWQDECNRERGDVQRGGSEDEEEKRVAAAGWQRYASELQRNGSAVSGGSGFGSSGGQAGELRGGGVSDGGGGDRKWAKRALSDAVSKWKMRSRL